MTTISSLNTAPPPVASGEELVRSSSVTGTSSVAQASETLAQNPAKAVVPTQSTVDTQRLKNLAEEVNQIISKFANAGTVQLALNTSDAQNPTIQILNSTRQVMRVVPAEEMMQIVQALNVLQGVLISVQA
ncbi:MAG: hypothetical protein KGI54_00430 [Pseudomonadota bacterium]|nr:hypothetical protein [Pseudomonadota bacterium]